jgi:hypothetical protein
MKALYPDLNDNTITLTLDDEDIENAQNQEGELQNIIEIPSETWDHVITEIDIPEQDYYNKIKINVEDIDESDNPNTITIQIPETPTLNQQDILENIDVEDSELITYNENDLDYGTTINIDLSEYKKNIKTLETITNIPLQSNQTTYTISDLMTNQNADGITKDSTLYVNVPVTPTPPTPTIGFANITENGQYLPIDFNSQGEYDPLNPNNNFDYLNQINVNINTKLNKNNFYIKYGTQSGYDNNMPLPPTSGYTQLSLSLINGNVYWDQYDFYIVLGNYNNNFTIGYYQPASSSTSNYYLGLYRSGTINISNNQYVWVYYLENNNYNLLAVFRDCQSSNGADINFVYFPNYQLV